MVIVGVESTTRGPGAPGDSGDDFEEAISECMVA